MPRNPHCISVVYGVCTGYTELHSNYTIILSIRADFMLPVVDRTITWSPTCVSALCSDLYPRALSCTVYSNLMNVSTNLTCLFTFGTAFSESITPSNVLHVWKSLHSVTLCFGFQWLMSIQYKEKVQGWMEKRWEKNKEDEYILQTAPSVCTFLWK